VDPDLDPGGQKWPTKKEKKNKKFHVLKCWMFSCEGFSYCLEVLHGGIGINKLQFLEEKNGIFFPAVTFYQFCSSKSWILIHNRPKILELNPDPH
jgi:hypothetical protein